MNVFNVTYEIVTPESVEFGEAESQGFICESVSLREAFDAIGGCAIEADCYPISHRCPPRWFTNDEYGNGTATFYACGERESRALHLPRNVTPSSALRIARLLGVTHQ